MNITQVTKKKNLAHLTIERNVSVHTERAYASDLKQFIVFINRIEPEEKKHLTIRQTH